MTCRHAAVQPASLGPSRLRQNFRNHSGKKATSSPRYSGRGGGGRRMFGPIGLGRMGGFGHGVAHRIGTDLRGQLIGGLRGDGGQPLGADGQIVELAVDALHPMG